MNPDRTTRRRLLEMGGLGLGSVVAGCFQLSETTETPADTPTYTAIRESEVYLGPAIADELPDYVTVVDSATAADIAIVAYQTTHSGDTLVSWLVAGVPTGVWGEPAITRLVELLRAGDVTDHFEGEYLSAGREPHDIAVFAPDGDEMNSYTGRFDGYDPPLVSVVDDALAFVLENEP